MSEPKEIPFKELKPGTAFESRRTKRNFHGLKIVEIQKLTVSPPALFGEFYSMNAVITKDHAGNLAQDAGILTRLDDDMLVIPE